MQGVLHEASGSPSAAIVLAHGASSNRDSFVLCAFAEAFAQAGVEALRIDMAYRRVRPSGPPSPAGAAKDRASIADAAAWLAKRGRQRIFGGGHSYGGRQTTMLAGEEPALFAGLLLLSYPLHAPGQPERVRVEHFPRIAAPCLFVHGPKDPFGSLAEMREHLPAIARFELMPVEGAGHELLKKTKQSEIPARAVAAFLRLTA